MAGMETEGFNALMDDFLANLLTAFPREKDAITDAQTAFLHMSKSKDPKKTELPRIMFMDGVRNHAPYIRKRDDEYMNEHMDEIPFIKSLNLSKYWGHPDMPVKTRAAVWDHLTRLLMLGSTIENIDPSMLPMIDQIAKSAMDSEDFSNIASGSGDMPDMAEIMQRMMKSGAMSGLKDAGYAGLSTGMGTMGSSSAGASAISERPNRTAQRRSKKKKNTVRSQKKQ